MALALLPSASSARLYAFIQAHQSESPARTGQNDVAIGELTHDFSNTLDTRTLLGLIWPPRKNEKVA